MNKVFKPLFLFASLLFFSSFSFCEIISVFNSDDAILGACIGHSNIDFAERFVFDKGKYEITLFGKYGSRESVPLEIIDSGNLQEFFIVRQEGFKLESDRYIFGEIALEVHSLDFVRDKGVFAFAERKIMVSEINGEGVFARYVNRVVKRPSDVVKMSVFENGLEKCKKYVPFDAAKNPPSEEFERVFLNGSNDEVLLSDEEWVVANLESISEKTGILYKADDFDLVKVNIPRELEAYECSINGIVLGTGISCLFVEIGIKYHLQFKNESQIINFDIHNFDARAITLGSE